MKYAIIIPDGAADTVLEQLNGKTPLETAHTPTLDKLAQSGRQGTVETTPLDSSGNMAATCGSDICTMSLLGYDPLKYHSGRAPLEAAAMGIPMKSDDWIFRLNLVTIIDGVMQDHSAGHITDTESKALLQDFVARIEDPAWQIYHGVSYRNIMVDRQTPASSDTGTKKTSTTRDWSELATTAPHDILGAPVKKHLPVGGAHADTLRRLIELSGEIFKEHEINLTRRDMGEALATHIWPWGQGTAPNLPSFASQFGLKNCAMITAVDLLGGIAKLIGWRKLDVPGQTSYHDNDYNAAGSHAAAALNENDLVCVHIEAPDEASHAGDAKTKVQSIEAIDQKVIAPIHAALEQRGEPYRMLILPDHYTRIDTRKHDPTPVPFLMCGSGIHNIVAKPWSEANAQRADLHIPQGHELMEYFLFSGLDKR